MKVKRPFLLGAGIGTGIALIAGIGFAISMRPTLQLGVGYGAHVICSCRYIGGRDLQSCYHDYEPGMELIRMHDDEQEKRVTANVPLLASRSAQFREGLGCVLEPLPGED